MVRPSGATIEGEIKPPETEKPGPVMVALLRQAGDTMVLEKQEYSAIVDPASAIPKRAPYLKHFVMEGVGPGDYVLYAWRRDAEIEYADSEYMRQFTAYG